MKQSSSVAENRYREDERDPHISATSPADNTSSYAETKGRNASFFRLDINITSGEPQQGKTGHFVTFGALVLVINLLYLIQQRHHLHKRLLW